MPDLVHVYLTRRNLLVLLNKLDRKKKGQGTACTILKFDNTHPVYPQSVPVISVMALEDEEYYTHRPPGAVHPEDEPSRIPQQK